MADVSYEIYEMLTNIAEELAELNKTMHKVVDRLDSIDETIGK